MTSRRMEGHKNYYEVMKKHQRSSRIKKAIRLTLLLLFFILLITMVYFSFKMTIPEEDIIENESISLTISRPDISQYVSLNKMINGKTQKP